jgi:homoserine kinase
MKFLVRTPATVANLGPGFDCLGLAVDLWNEMEVAVTGNSLEVSIEGEGCDTLPKDESNKIYRSMATYALRMGKTLPPGIRLRCHNRIPLASGLGSSSAATLAGIISAVTLLELPDDKADQLDCAAEIEGHPDNAAPCLLGGFTISIVVGDRVITRKIQVQPHTLVIVTPEFHFPTSQARVILPDQVSRQDAVFNLGRVALLSEALRTGDMELLAGVSEDRLHQPYRVPLIPGAEAAMSAAREAGAIAVVLAGAGPSLLAIVRDRSHGKVVGDAMIASFQVAGLSTRRYTPAISNVGASVQNI